MDAAREFESGKHVRSAPTGGGETVELTAITTILVLLVCVAASVLVTAPQMMEAAAHLPPALQETVWNNVSERPFHERYRMSAADDSVAPPTF